MLIGCSTVSEPRIVTETVTLTLRPPLELRKVCEVPEYHGTTLEHLLDHIILLTTEMHRCSARDKKRNEWYEAASE